MQATIEAGFSGYVSNIRASTKKSIAYKKSVYDYPRTKDFCIKSMCTNQIVVSYLKPQPTGDCYFTIGPSSPTDFTTLYFISIRVFIQNSEQFQYFVQYLDFQVKKASCRWQGTPEFSIYII